MANGLATPLRGERALVCPVFRRAGFLGLWCHLTLEEDIDGDNEAGIRARESKIYCAVVLDVCSRRVVGWSIDSSATADRRTGANPRRHSDALSHPRARITPTRRHQRRHRQTPPDRETSGLAASNHRPTSWISARMPGSGRPPAAFDAYSLVDSSADAAAPPRPTAYGPRFRCRTTLGRRG